MTEVRLDAANQLLAWLEKGGPRKGQRASRGKKAAGTNPKVLHVLFEGDGELIGKESNISMKAKKIIPQGTAILAVGMTCVLHPRSDAVPAERRQEVERLAAAVRAEAPWRTPLIDGRDAGRLEVCPPPPPPSPLPSPPLPLSRAQTALPALPAS